MKLITIRPVNYDELNNPYLRSGFEDTKNEPMIHTKLKACGSISNDEESFAIDQYDEDGETLYNSFLYSSEHEYKQDLKILGINIIN